MEEYKVVITQRAFSAINECVLFVNMFSKEASKELYSEIISSIGSLKALPSAYPNIEGLTVGGMNIKRMPIHKGMYIIIYKIEKDLVTIYDVVDSSKDNSILKI